MNAFQDGKGLLRIIVIAFALLTGCAAPSTVLPQSSATPPPSVGKPTGKLSPRLDMLANSPALRAANANEQARALSLPPNGPGSLMRDAQGRILVNIRVADVSSNTLQSLRDAGAAITFVAEAYRQVTAFVAVTDLPAIANLSNVENVEEQLSPATSGGAVVPYPPQ